MRIALVGAGPRALWAVEALADAAGAVRPEVDVFDPHPLGVGAAYDPAQPPWLRLNVTSAIVKTGSGALDDWRRRRGEPDPLDPFPPRALVGAFLADAWQAVGRRIGVRHVATRVTVTPADRGWLVAGQRYDHVLLATGHEPTWPGAWSHRQPDAVAVYPVTRLDAIPDRADVAVRGAALTFLDAALALSEGRGGAFTPSGYAASGREPRLRPFSPSGRFMEPKPIIVPPGLDEPRAAGLAAIRADAGGVRTVIATLRTTATAYLRAAGGAGDIDAVLAGTDGGNPVADLRHSLAVATGAAAPHAPWAVGQAFRDLYPAIVASLGFERADDWPTFARVARTLERVAFGPPAVNAAKLLALVDAGVVAAPVRDTGAAACHVDAVLPPPGVVPGSLAEDLVRRGVADIARGRRGLRTDAAGFVPGRAGLAVVGRVTEDVVIGNDTLSRALHEVVPRWAERVLHHA